MLIDQLMSIDGKKSQNNVIKAILKACSLFSVEFSLCVQLYSTALFKNCYIIYSVAQ